VAVIACHTLLDKIYIRLREAHKGPGQPEYRLPLPILGAFTLPMCIAAYGWIVHFHLPLPALVLSITLMGCSLMLAFLPLMAYVVDAFGLYSASAVTGLIVFRCLVGTFLPLTTGPLVKNLGYGWGFTVLAGLGFAIAPIPMLTMRYGGTWRQRSKYSRST